MSKIVTLDIETFADTARVWGGSMYEVNLIKKVSYGGIASFAYKWLDQKRVYCHTREGQRSDKALLRRLREVLDAADYVVAQNGKKFDVREIRKRMMLHRIPRPAPFRVIDTLAEMKKIARLDNYSLDSMCQFFGIGSKLKHRGFEMWEGCEQDEPRAWREMEKYNKHDVALTDALYKEMRAWIETHPPIYNRPDSCPRCGSDRLKSHGIRKSNGRRQYFCKDCGGWCSERKAEKGFVLPNKKSA